MPQANSGTDRTEAGHPHGQAPLRFERVGRCDRRKIRTKDRRPLASRDHLRLPEGSGGPGWIRRLTPSDTAREITFANVALHPGGSGPVPVDPTPPHNNGTGNPSAVAYECVLGATSGWRLITCGACYGRTQMIPGHFSSRVPIHALLCNRGAALDFLKIALDHGLMELLSRS